MNQQQHGLLKRFRDRSLVGTDDGHYEFNAEIDALPRYLETHSEVDDDRLPEWDEFQELTADYEVRLP